MLVIFYISSTSNIYILYFIYLEYLLEYFIASIVYFAIYFIFDLNTILHALFILFTNCNIFYVTVNCIVYFAIYFIFDLNTILHGLFYLLTLIFFM